MSTKNNEVIVYSTPTCPYCVYTKQYFKEKGVGFKDVDVTKDHELVKEMVSKSGQMGVPVTDINGEIIVGFRPNVFEELLNK